MRLVVLFLSLLPLFASALPLKPAKHVFLISLDGAAPYVIQKSKMPNLKKMTELGSYSWTAQTILPSITLPSHTSMVTGVGPEVHGVLWNDWIPENGLVKVATIFSVAHQKGLRTALVSSKRKFRHLQTPNSIDHFEIVEAPAPDLAQAAIQVIKSEKPHLMMIHFRDPDYAGHALGWSSLEQKSALALVDVALGKILKALEQARLLKDSVVIVTADHGGHDRTHGTNMIEDMNIPWIAYGYGTKKGLLTQEIRTIDTAATALWLLGIDSPKGFQGKAVQSAFGL